MIEALGYPFVQRALVAGLLVGLVTSLLGVLVVLRRSAFFGDAVAHASLAGVAAGVVTGTSPLALAAVVAVSIGLSLHRFERSARLSLDTILGFVLPFFMAIGVLLLSLSPGFQPELLSYLFGSILTVSWEGLAAIAAVGAVVAAIMARHGRAMVFAAFDPDGAHAAGINVARLLTTFHVLLALAVIASISVVGIVLVNALLVIPAATAKLLAPSLRRMFVLAPLVGLSSVLAGLVASYRLDLPSGPAIVVVAGLALLIAWASAAARRAGAR
ncbi:MAG TPA: metal ABC transporter permease [Candidatus Deferrimicrobiaceae bacterium]|nr:metal ABC transporter permease [Candidatus Deferrimicrobiaceae bacterium]